MYLANVYYLSTPSCKKPVITERLDVDVETKKGGRQRLTEQNVVSDKAWQQP